MFALTLCIYTEGVPFCQGKNPHIIGFYTSEAGFGQTIAAIQKNGAYAD
jgi:hypothetical protein